MSGTARVRWMVKVVIINKFDPATLHVLGGDRI